MAYATPKTWAEGDTISVTDMQKYSDSLNAIHDIVGDAARFYGAAHLRPGEDNNHYARHTHRWLWYYGDGSLEDADALNETIILSSEHTDGTPTRYDLDSVPWLAPGKLYYLSDCIWFMETPEP